jgi:hypothetical protein
VIRHLFDLPDDLDGVRLMCGLTLSSAPRRDVVHGDPAIATCIACLRGQAVKLQGEVTRLTERAATLKRRVDELEFQNSALRSAAQSNQQWPNDTPLRDDEP